MGLVPGVADNRTLYELLGVAPGADAVSLRQAFRRRSKALHPDTTQLPPEQASGEFQRLCEAYAQLEDPQRRAAYDAGLQVSGSTLAASEASPSDAGWGHIGERRPLSGGEWLSIVLLLGALVFCLLLGVGIGWLRGVEFQVAPSWMLQEQTWEESASPSRSDASPAFGPDAAQSALPALSGALVGGPGGQPQR